MSNTVLLLGSKTSIGRKITKELALKKDCFARVAFLSTPSEDDSDGAEAESASVALERIAGSPSDAESYRGFDVVVSAVERDTCLQQTKFIDAAVAGGVRHFCPREYSVDLTHPLVRNEPYFADMLAVRGHLEEQAKGTAQLGYTYVMTGVSSDLLLDSNLLGMSDHQKAATYIGSPDAKVSVTHSDDVAKLVVESLLPNRLPDLAARRHVRLAGSTLRSSSLFDAIAYVLHQPISVKYEDVPTSPKLEKQQVEGKDAEQELLNSAKRAIGSGGSELRDPEPGNEDEGPGVLSYGNEYAQAVRPKDWAQIVADFFGRKSSEGRSQA